MMINNPFTDKVRQKFSPALRTEIRKRTWQTHMQLAAICSGGLPDNIDDYDEDTPEYRTACAVTDDWAALMDVYQSRIFAILIKKGSRIPETAQIHVLLPFMEQNGYICHSGWWYPENE